MSSGEYWKKKMKKLFIKIDDDLPSPSRVTQSNYFAVIPRALSLQSAIK